MAKYTIISGTKPDGSLAIKDGPEMTLIEAAEIAKEFDALGITDIRAETGFPIFCPTCKVLVDVDPKLEGFEKYCPVCEMNARNLITYNQLQNECSTCSVNGPGSITCDNCLDIKAGIHRNHNPL